MSPAYKIGVGLTFVSVMTTHHAWQCKRMDLVALAVFLGLVAARNLQAVGCSLADIMALRNLAWMLEVLRTVSPTGVPR